MKNFRKVIAVMLALALVNYYYTIPVHATSFDNAEVISAGSSVTSTLYDSNEMQNLYYRIDVPSIGMIGINIHIEDIRYGDYYIYKANSLNEYYSHGRISTDNNSGVGNKDLEDVVGPGTYYILFKNSGARNNNGHYVYPSGMVRVTYTFTNYNVMTNIDTNDNDSISKAANWDYSSTPTLRGATSSFMDDSKDIYKVTIKTSGDYHINIKASNKYDLSIYDHNGNKIYNDSRAYYKDVYACCVLDKDYHLDMGVYYLSIYGVNLYGYYDLTLKPVISQQSSSSSGSSSSSSKTSQYSNEWVNGKWYDADGNQSYNGTLVWKSNGNGWWVEDSAGWYPTSCWQKIDGVWYYFTSSGYMASNEYYCGCWFNSNGSWNENYSLSWRGNANGWWVEDKSGWWPQNSWLKIDGNWYYFNGSGYMVTNQYVGGYWIGSDGVCR